MCYRDVTCEKKKKQHINMWCLINASLALENLILFRKYKTPLYENIGYTLRLPALILPIQISVKTFFFFLLLIIA